MYWFWDVHELRCSIAGFAKGFAEINESKSNTVTATKFCGLCFYALGSFIVHRLMVHRLSRLYVLYCRAHRGTVTVIETERP